MKLGGKNIVTPDRGGKRFTVGSARGDNRLIERFGKKTVHKINVAACGDSQKERTTVLRQVDLIPANLRNFQSVPVGEPDHIAFENPQSGSATVELLASLEKRLVTHANPKKRAA